MTRVETLAIIYQHPRVLLGMKKVRFGKGKYNGFGGGLEDGESLKECVIRETLDEAGVKLINPEKKGMLLFNFESDEQDHEVHIYLATNFNGEPKESDEMKPEWFYKTNIPYHKMWDDDKYWLPNLLQGMKFFGKFQFDLEGKVKTYKLHLGANIK